MGVILSSIDLIMIQQFLTTFCRFIGLLYRDEKTKKILTLACTYFLALMMLVSSVFFNIYRNVINVGFAFYYQNGMSAQELKDLTNNENQYIKILETICIYCENFYPTCIGFGVLMIYYNLGSSHTIIFDDK